MHTTKFRLLLGSAALALTALPVQAEEVLRGVTAFATGTTFSRPFEAFVERVNEQGEGVVQIDYVGGPEAVPTFEVGNAVSDGIVDIANVTSAFYPNLLPVGDALHLATNTVQEQRENGCFELIDQLHQERMNAKYLARTGDNIQFHIYLTEEVDGPDLSGLTIRTTPVYRAMLEELGATPVRTAPGEVYTALERGAIDGYGWPIQGVMDLGWDEQTNYRIDPGFYQVDVNFLVNLDRWTALPDEAKQVLQDAALWVEEKNAENIEINEREAQAQQEAGIEVIGFEGETAEGYLETAQEAGWAAIEEIDAEAAGELRACLTE